MPLSPLQQHKSHPLFSLIEQRRFKLFMNEVGSRMVASAAVALALSLPFIKQVDTVLLAFWYTGVFTVSLLSYLIIKRYKNVDDSPLSEDALDLWRGRNMLLSVSWGILWSLMPFTFLTNATPDQIYLTLAALIMISSIPSISMGCYPEIYITFITPVFLSMGFNIYQAKDLSIIIVYMSLFAWVVLCVFSLIIHKNQIKLIIKSVELEHTQKKLSRANETKDYMIGILGHDLRQPILSAKLYLDMIFSKPEHRETGVAVIETLDITLENLNHIIKKADLKNRDSIISLQFFSAEELLESTLKPLRQKLIITDNLISSSLDNALFKTDKFILERILENILQNYLSQTRNNNIKIAFDAFEPTPIIRIVCSTSSEPGSKSTTMRKTFDTHLQGYGLIIVERLCRILEIKLTVYKSDLEGWVTELHLPSSMLVNK